MSGLGSRTTETRLVNVGEHECVTCERCATTFAIVHPACPACAERAARVRAEEALRAHHYQRDFALRQEFCEICRVALAGENEG